jgi:hypothetical protein
MPTLASGNEQFYPNADPNGASTIKCYYDDAEKKVKCVLFTPSSEEVYCVKSNKLHSCKGNCDSTECYQLTHKAGYYLPATLNGLISCSESACSMKGKSDIKKGYYLSEDNNKPLIFCNESNGDIRCNYEEKVNNGSYIGGESKTIINCMNNSCGKGTISSTSYYKSGEEGQQLIICDPTLTPICSSENKPETGYYKSSNNIIKCTSSNNGSVNCEIKENANKGYYIDATEKRTAVFKYGISQSGGSLDKGYFVSGEANQLINCGTSSSSECKEQTGNGWYILGDRTDTVIYCNNGCETISNLKKRKIYMCWH